MWQDHATLYEKLVFDSVSYLLSEDRDDDVALELHSKVSDSMVPFEWFAQFEDKFDVKWQNWNT